MVDKARSQAGNKGAAIRAAKKQAAETNSSIMLPEFGVFVDPTGDVFPLSSVLTEEEKRARNPELGTPEVVNKKVQEAEPTKGHLMHPDKENVAEAAEVAEGEPLVEKPGGPMTATEVNRRMGRPDDWRPGDHAVEEKPGEISVDHIEGTGFLIGERLPLSGEYVHIARAATKKIVEEFLTMRDLGIPDEKAMTHLNERHGEGAITYGTEKPVAPPTPPSMAPLTEPGVEAEEKAVYQPEDVPFSVGIEAPDQPKAILDAVAESEERATRAEEAYHDKGDRMAAVAEDSEPAGLVAAVSPGLDALGKSMPELPPEMPDTILGRANWLVENHGLSEADALSLAQVQLGAVATRSTIPGAPATPGDGEMLGPDKTMVEAYQKRMETYVAPRLECEIKVENPDGDDWVFPMPVRFLDYLLRSAEWETIKRRREVTPADRLQQILREYRRDDQEVRLLMAPGAASGPAGTFNPASGRWE